MSNPNSRCLEFLNNKEERKAFECYLENSKNGDAMANYMVGELFLNGTGVEIDYKNATKHYIESNEPLALYRLGQINYYGWGDEINYPASFEWFTKASERGLVEANYYLGSMYYNGNGVEKNIELAIERLEKIANSGVESEMMEKSRHLEYLSFSQGLLGQIYSEPENFDDKDKDEIHRKSGYWYFESARNGNERSKAFTIFGGRFFPIDGGDSCANEHVHFKNLELLDFSESITKKYLNQGNELFDLAIESANELLAEDIKKSNEGDPEAEYWMAQRYDNGLMVEKDLKKSFRFAKSSADKGYKHAQAMLGIYLLEGTGVNIDIGQSIKYLTFAQQKDDFFSYALARAYEAESPYQNLKKAYDLFVAFKANWKIGLYNELGLIDSPNLSLAKEAYEKASKNGVVEAKVRLAVWQFLGIETVEDIESASKELYAFWDRVDIKELLMIEHYEKLFSETLTRSAQIQANEIASVSLSCAQQCLRAYSHFNVRDLYGADTSNKILLRGINWFIKSFNYKEYSEIVDFYKKEFLNSISTESEKLIQFHEGGFITPKVLYIFASQFRLYGFESRAIPIYDKLAHLGFGVPQFIIGISYAQGVFNPQNYLKSYAWLNLASSNGIEVALKSRDKVARQISPNEVALGQKLAEEIQLSIKSQKISHELYEEIRTIEKLDLTDIEASFIDKFFSFFNDKEDNHRTSGFRVRRRFKQPSFNAPAFSSNGETVSQKKPKSESIFGTIVKVLLFLPFAALFAWLIYIVAAISLVWVFVKFAS